MSAIEEVHESLLRRARDAAHRTAVISPGEDRSLTFAQLGAEVERRRRFLESRLGGGLETGRGPHRPVGLAIGNRIDFLGLVFALFALEVSVVLLDPARSIEALRDLCRTLGLSALLRERVEDASPSFGRAPTTDVELEILSDVEPARLPRGTALVKLTSGSTGAPRGACFDMASLGAGIAQIGAGMEIDSSDRVLLAIPLSHSYGFDNGVLSLAALGTPLVLHAGIGRRGLLPRDLAATVRRHEVTVLPLVPPLVRALAAVDWTSDDAPPHRLRRVLSAGGRLAPEDAAAFDRAAGVPVHQFYGSSETGGIAFERAPREPGAVGTVGTPLPGVTVTLESGGEDTDALANRVWVDSAANRIGELGVTSLALDRRVAPGDLGEWTTGGRLRLVGRSAAVLNVGGRKVAIAQVEAALQALDGVEAAAVLGVDDPARGDRVVAFVVADRWPIDATPLPRPWRPRETLRLDRLPFTSRGKIDRAALRARLAERP